MGEGEGRANIIRYILINTCIFVFYHIFQFIYFNSYIFSKKENLSNSPFLKICMN